MDRAAALTKPTMAESHIGHDLCRDCRVNATFKLLPCQHTICDNHYGADDDNLTEQYQLYKAEEMVK